MGAAEPERAPQQTAGAWRMTGNSPIPADVIGLPDRALYRVSGADKAAFFDRVLTQNFSAFGSAGQPNLVYAALLTPQGKVVGDLFCGLPESAEHNPDGPDRPDWPDRPDRPVGDFLLDLPQSRAGQILAVLNRYRLRAQVEYASWPGLGVWACDTPPSGAFFAAPDPRPGMGWRAYLPVERMVLPGSEPGVYRARRFDALVPDPACDSLHESDFALELNLDLLSAIDFKKGCFVGQEVTSRMKRKGRIRTRSRCVEIAPDPGPDESGPDYGARIFANGLELGEIRSALPPGFGGTHDGIRAIAVIRLDRWAEADPGQIRLADGRAVRLIGALED